MSYVHPYGSTLPEQGVIGRGYGLISDTGRVEFRVTQSGNLELYLDGSRKLWSFDNKNASFVKMQTDGNCVAYQGDGTAVWHTATNGSDHPYALVCQNDGNLVLYAKGGRAVWHTNTAVVH
ncbi:mannose recognizing lectin [Marasmius fiardii PR-910]|nr:mannose recognizing lectin [Marasmius fiardii PR-910]